MEQPKITYGVFAIDDARQITEDTMGVRLIRIKGEWDTLDDAYQKIIDYDDSTHKQFTVLPIINKP